MAVSCAMRLPYQTPLPQPSHFLYDPMTVKTEIMPTCEYSGSGSAFDSKLSLFKRVKTEEPQLTSWTKKHPQHWTREEVLDWVYFVVDQLHLDGSLVPGEAYQSINGNRLCHMSRSDFQRTDPVYGASLYEVFCDLLKDVNIRAPKPIEDNCAINFDCFAEHNNSNYYNSHNFKAWNRDSYGNNNNNNNNNSNNLSLAISVNSKSSCCYGNNENKSAINTNIVVYGQDNEVKVDLGDLGVYSISTDFEFPATASAPRTMTSSLSTSPHSTPSSLTSLLSTSSSAPSFHELSPVVPMSTSTNLPMKRKKSQSPPAFSPLYSSPASSMENQHHYQQQHHQHRQQRQTLKLPLSQPYVSATAAASLMPSSPQSSSSLPTTVTSLDSPPTLSSSHLSSSSSSSTAFNSPLTSNQRIYTSLCNASTPSSSTFSMGSTIPMSSLLSSSSSTLSSTDLSSTSLAKLDVGDPDYVSDDDLFVNCPISGDVEMDMDRTVSYTDDLNLSRNNDFRERKRRKSKGGHTNKGTHLWEFVRDLLRDPKANPKLLKWEDKETGVFRFVQSEAVAQLWGEKKKNPLMTYEKLSRAMRFCRKAGFFNSVPKNGRFPKKLCFMFGNKASDWRD